MRGKGKVDSGVVAGDRVNYNLTLNLSLPHNFLLVGNFVDQKYNILGWKSLFSGI